MLRKAMSCWSGTVQEKYTVKDENTGRCEVAVVPMRRLPAGQTAVVTGDPPLVHVLVNILASQHVYMLTRTCRSGRSNFIGYCHLATPLLLR